MKNRRPLIFWGVILLLAVMVLNPHKVLAEDVVTIPGIVEVEENHLYMVPIGTDDGVKKGDTIEVTRGDEKIADARLISVLSDNSMAEIIVLFVRTDILESDSVKFIRKIEAQSIKRKTLGAGGTAAGKTTAVVPGRASEEKRRGLLGSEMHRYEEVVAVEGPLQKEIEQLKAGLISVRDTYESKVDTILSSVGGEKDVLAVEKKWKEKLVSTEKRYQAQYRERKRLLEKEAARLEAKVASLNKELKVVNKGTDKRVQQLLSDLRNREDEISSLKQTFVEEHLAGERQWKAKLENLEAQYQSQLRTQQESLEKESATEREKFQNDINYLTEQVELVQESAGNQNSELQVRLKEREDLIDALRKEQIGLESDFSRESAQVRRLESDAMTLKDVIAATKRVHAKELEISRKPLETKIEDMSVEFISVKHDYERELNALRQGSQEDLLKNESEWVEKLTAVEQKYQGELSQLNSQSAAQINQLRAELEGQKDVAELLKQNKVELTSQLKASEQQFAQSQSDLNALANQLSVEKATRQEKTNLAKQPLEEKVAELSSQIVSLRQEYENQFAQLRRDNTKQIGQLQSKTSEDAALIEFLNNAMVDLTADLDDREQQVINLQDDLKLSLGENEAMKKSYLERIQLAKEPLEAKVRLLDEEIISLKKNNEDQIKGIQENTSRDLMVSEEKWQVQFTVKEKEHEQKLITVRREMGGQIMALQETIASVNEENQNTLALSQEDSEKRMSAFQQEWEEKLGASTQLWQAQLNDAETQYTEALNEEAAKKQSVIDFLKEEKSDLIARMATSQKDYETRIREMEVVAQQGQATVNEQWQAKLTAKENEHQQELDVTIASLKQDYETKITEIKDASTQKQTSSDEQWQAKFADRENKYQQEMGRIKNTNGNQIAKLNEELGRERQVISQLENTKSDLAKQISVLQKDHAVAVKKAEDDSKQMQTASNERWEARLKENEKVIDLLENDKSRLAIEIASLKKDHAEKIRDLENNSKQNRAASDEQWQQKLASKEKKYQNEIRIRKDNSDSRIAKLNEELKKEQQVASRLNNEKSDLAKQISALERDHLAEISKLASDSKQSQTASNEQWQAKLADKEKKYQDEINKMQTSSSSRIAKLDEERQKERQAASRLDNEKADLAKQISVLQRDHAAEIKRIEKDSRQSRTDSTEQWQARLKENEKVISLLEDDKSRIVTEIASLKGDHRTEIKRIENDSKQNMITSDKRWQSEFANIKRKHQKALDAEIQEKKKAISALKDERSDLAKQMSAFQKDHETEIKRIENDSKQNQVASDKQWQAKLESQERALEGKIASLNDQLNFLKKDSGSIIDDIQDQLKKKQNEVDSLMKENSDLASNLVQKENRLAKSEDSVAVLKDQIKETWSSRSKWIASVKRPLEDEIKKLNSEIVSLRKGHESEIAVLKKGSGEDAAVSDKQWQTKLEKQQEDYEKKKQNADERYNDLKTMMISLKEDHKKELNSLEDISKEKLSVAEERFQKELAAQKEESQEKLDQQKQNSQERIAGLNEQLDLFKSNGDQTIEQLRLQLEERRQLVSSLEKRVSELTSTLEKRDKRLAELDGDVSQLNQELKAARSSYDDQVRIAKRPLEEKIKILDGELESLWDEAKKELKEVEEQWEDKLEANEDKWQVKSERDEKLWKKKLSNVEEEKKDEIASLRRQLKMIQNSRAKDIKRAKKSLEGEIKSLNKELGSLLDEAKEELAIVEDEWRDKLKEKDREISRLRKKPEAEWKEKFAENDQRWGEKFIIAEEKYQKGLKNQEESLQVQIAELNTQLDVLTGDSSSVIDQLQIDLKAKQSSLSALEKERSEFKESLDEKYDELVKSRSKVDGLKEELRVSISRRSKVIKSAKEPLEAQVEELEEELASVKKDYEYKIKTEGPREVAALKDQIRELEGTNERRLELLKNELKIERRIVADLEKEKAALRLEASEESSREKRLELANRSLEAEIRKLNSQMAFMKDDHEKKIKFLKRQDQDDLRASEEQWQAKLSASEAQWKTKWAVREAEHQQKMSEEMESLEKRIFGGKKEVQATIVSLNNRFNMLKNGSDSQIRELETDLAAQQYQLTVREAEFQERLMDVDRRWAQKLELAQKQHQEELDNRKRVLSQDFLDEKKELRETVIDLTRQFNELRDSSSDRIRDLEDDVERKEYKLSLLENRSQQDLLGTEEKWQAKLAAMEEKRQRELMEQKQDMEQQFLADKEKLQSTVGDLNRQINSLSDQYRLDLALNKEEAAAEMALLERKYQDQLSGLKEGSTDEVDALTLKAKRQQDLIDSLEQEKSGLEFDLEQRERELARFRSDVDNLKKETKMTELSQSEKLRLSKQSLETRIEELSSQLAITKKKAAQERDGLEERWKTKLEKTEEDYLQKIKLQRQNLEEEAAILDNKIGMLKSDQGNTVREMQIEIEDNQMLIRLLSKEKYELAAGLEEKSRMIVMLNEDIIDLKEDLETYKDMIPLSSSLGLDNADDIKNQALASEDEPWYDSPNALREEYYTAIRGAILNKFREFDFSDYEGKEDLVKIDFELLANGSPKKDPEFLGTQDQGLKDLLTKCFKGALPFPPFPENLGKEPQRFSLGISFRKQ